MIEVRNCKNCKFSKIEQAKECEDCVKTSNFEFDVIPYYMSFSEEARQYIYKLSHPGKELDDERKNN